MSLAMASIPMKGDMWKATKIYIAALHCILLSLLSGYDSGTLL